MSVKQVFVITLILQGTLVFFSEHLWLDAYLYWMRYLSCYICPNLNNNNKKLAAMKISTAEIQKNDKMKI